MPPQNHFKTGGYDAVRLVECPAVGVKALKLMLAERTVATVARIFLQAEACALSNEADHLLSSDSEEVARFGL